MNGKSVIAALGEVACAFLAGIALGMLAMLAGCSILNKPADPACQGDPALKPCPCMDPRTPGCPAPPNDNGDNPSTMTKKPDGGIR